MRLLDEKSVLLIVDVQEKLLPAMAEADLVVRGCATLLAAAQEMRVPVLVSEQYPAGLGGTVETLRAAAGDATVVDKVHFSCAADEDWMAAFSRLGRTQAIIAGIEAHVCVLQTALALLEQGIEVAVVADAVSSRRPGNKALALDRLRANGVEVVSVEMVLFEWMHSAQTPEFKAISKLIK
jgi:nicotinamidase-related amidase